MLVLLTIVVGKLLLVLMIDEVVAGADVLLAAMFRHVMPRT